MKSIVTIFAMFVEIESFGSRPAIELLVLFYYSNDLFLEQDELIRT